MIGEKVHFPCQTDYTYIYSVCPWQAKVLHKPCVGRKEGEKRGAKEGMKHITLALSA